VLDQPGALQHAQVLADGGAAHRQPAGQLPHRQRAVAQALQDPAPHRVAERVERVVCRQLVAHG
jgi:hypothetical protein